jgi:exosortase A
MATIWARSETHTHAFIVPPISLWLIWRMRHQLKRLQPASTLWLVPPLAATVLFWLMGELTAVNALTQAALVVAIILATVALLGFRVSKEIAFPLAFLLFSIPVGDFMLPWLMDWTAAFTVFALRATGIPVYQEGLQFVIPSGNWSVVEACSGVRYIIASLTVGTIFAYLNYVSLRRRLAFVAVSLLVPIIANWLRAYMIVMIGHLSGNKLAVGVDHLIYGWVFFGFVMMIMFMIGARWSEARPDSPLSPAPVTSNANASPAWLVAIVLAAITAAGPLAFMGIVRADAAAAPKLGELPSPAGWSKAPPFTSWKPEFANPSAEQEASFSDGRQPVGVYIAYYRNQGYDRKLITSTNTLVKSDNRSWSVVARNTEHNASANSPPTIRSAKLLGKENGVESRLVVWQWYWINGHLTTSDFEAKLLTALSRMRGQGDDSAAVILYSPLEGGTTSLATFADAAAPQIHRLLAATREGR